MWEFVVDIGVLPRSHIFSLCLTPCGSRSHALLGGGVLMGAQKPLEFRQRVGVEERECESPSGDHP